MCLALSACGEVPRNTSRDEPAVAADQGQDLPGDLRDPGGADDLSRPGREAPDVDGGPRVAADAAADEAPLSETGTSDPGAAPEDLPDEGARAYDAETTPDTHATEGAVSFGHPCPEARAAPGPGLGGQRSTPAFDEANGALGLPDVVGETISVGDVDGDGWPDLWIPQAIGSDGEHAADSVVYLNCPNGFEPLVLESETWDAGLTPVVNASTVADLDGDGRSDLVSSHQGRLLAWMQVAPLTFARRDLWPSTMDHCESSGCQSVASLAVVDADGDGDRDLLVSRLAPYRLDGGPDELADANLLLRNDGSGRFEDLGPAASALTAAGRAITYALQWLRLPSAPDEPLLYVGNDTEVDAVYRQTAAWSFAPVDEAVLLFTTMGIDHAHLDGGDQTVLAASATGAYPLLAFAGTSSVADVSDRVSPAAQHNHWGVVFADFDNDGDEDLAYAAGFPDLDPTGVQWAGADKEVRLILLTATPADDGPRYSDVGDGAGVPFSSAAQRNWYALLHADLDRDGCMDLLATPMRRSGYEDEALVHARFDGPITVLRNRCGYPGGWIAWRLADRAGTLISVTLERTVGAPVTRWREVKAASSVGGRSDTSTVHMGLEPGARITAGRVRCPDGASHELAPGALTARQTHDLRALCP